MGTEGRRSRRLKRGRSARATQRQRVDEAVAQFSDLFMLLSNQVL